MTEWDYTNVVEELKHHKIAPWKITKLLHFLDGSFITLDAAMVILEATMGLRKERKGY